MHVAIATFPRFTALDAIGPYEVMQRIPELDIVFVGHERGEVRTENGMLGVIAAILAVAIVASIKLDRPDGHGPDDAIDKHRGEGLDLLDES